MGYYYSRCCLNLDDDCQLHKMSIGLVDFVQGTSLESLNDLVPYSLIKRLHFITTNIYVRYYGTDDVQNIQALFSKIQVWKLKCLRVYGKSGFQELPIAIKNIRFPYLKKLHINNNLIQSIETLQCLYAPDLQQLWLSTNRIIKISSLRKANFPKLNVIDIEPFSQRYQTDLLPWHQTKITDLQTLQQMNMGQIPQNFFFLDYPEQIRNRVSKNFSWIVKMNKFRYWQEQP